MKKSMEKFLGSSGTIERGGRLHRTAALVTQVKYGCININNLKQKNV